MIPLAKDKYRPRADSSLFSRLIQEAWESYQAAHFSDNERAAAASTVARHLESLVPADDLVVLRRYGYAEEVSYVCVRIHDGHDYRHSCGVDLPRKVWTTTNLSSLYCGGAWHSEDPLYGVTPTYRQQISNEDWQKHIKHCAECDRIRLPKAIEPYFAKVVEAQKTYKAEYRRSLDYPVKFKAENGHWPTWREIATALPVLGAHLSSLRELGVAA